MAVARSWKPVVSGTPLSFISGSTTEFANFQAGDGRVGLMIPATGLITPSGHVFEMATSTSTRRAPVTGINSFNLLRTSPGRSRIGGEFAGFTVQGTAQGHDYNGLCLDHLIGHHVHDLVIRGIPGSADSPPGETFALNEFGGINGVFERIEVDGRDLNGRRVGASVGLNSATNTTLNDWYVHDLAYGFPTAWQQNGLTTHNVRSVNNQLGFNHERCAGPIRHYGLVAHLDRSLDAAGMHLTFNNDWADNPDIEVHMMEWSGGAAVAGSALKVMIGHSYAPVPSSTGVQRQVTLPRIFAADGSLMHWADAGYAALNIPPANLSNALADPQHWAVRFH
jgi:hypothetical protein